MRHAILVAAVAVLSGCYVAVQSGYADGGATTGTTGAAASSTGSSGTTGGACAAQGQACTGVGLSSNCCNINDICQNSVCGFFQTDGTIGGASTGTSGVTSGVTSGTTGSTGTGGCDLQLNPQSLNFGTVNTGTPVVRSTTLSNVGTQACVITGVSLDPSSDPSYSLDASSASSPFTLTAGSAAAIAVDFNLNNSSTPSTRNGAVDIFAVAAGSVTGT